MDKKWKRRVGRLNIQTPPPKLKKTRYIDDNGIIRVTIHDGTFSPPEPVQPEYLYFEADQDEASVYIVSTLAIAPNIEYSKDGISFSELPHTTSNSTHIFEIITLENKGDKVYLRGENTALSTSTKSTIFKINGGVIAGGVITTLLDKKGNITELPSYAFTNLFYKATVDNGYTVGYMKNAPSFGDVKKIGAASCRSMYYQCSLGSVSDMSKITHIDSSGCTDMYSAAIGFITASNMNNVLYIGNNGCSGMYAGTSVEKAAGIKNATSIGANCFKSMYMGCEGLTLIKNGNLTFEFPELPISDASGKIYSTPQDVVDAMTYNPWA